MKRVVALILAIFLGISLAVPASVPAYGKGKGTFLELFFKKSPQKKSRGTSVKRSVKKKKSTKKRKSNRPRVGSKKAVAAAPLVIKSVDKNAGASKLFVFGDSMASNLATGLTRIYADDPNLIVVSAAKGSSGFVRDDFYDWNAAITDYLATQDIGVAVISIGVNDRQLMRADGKSHKSLSDSWKVEYRARITQFLQSLRSANVPVIWVGLPPMRATGYSTAMSQISSLHRSVAFTQRAEFVDIFERFIDENGKFTSVGPNLNGASVSMRASDGIHFTRAGNEKVAFFVEKAVRQFYTGGSLSAEIFDPLAGTVAANMIRPPYQGVGQGRLLNVAGDVVMLDQPLRDAGGLVVAGRIERSVFDLKVLMEVPAGRADGFYPVKVEDEDAEADEQKVSSLN